MQDFNIALFIFLTIITFMTSIGNILVIIAFIRDKRLRKQTGTWCMISLAVADTGVGSLVMLPTALQEASGSWLLGEPVCLVWISMDYVFCIVTIQHLPVIAVDRFRAVAFPLTYTSKKGRIGTQIALACIWAVPILGRVISLAFVYPPIVRMLHSFHICIPLGEDVMTAVFMFFITFLLPSIIVIILYTRIIYILRQRNLKINAMSQIKPGDNETTKPSQATEVVIEQSINTTAEFSNVPSSTSKPQEGKSNSEDHEEPSKGPGGKEEKTKSERNNQPAKNKAQQRGDKNKKVHRMVTVIIFTVILCWTPFFIFYITNAAGIVSSNLFASTANWLGYFNSALNPWIYGLMNKDIRTRILDILCCRKKTL